MEPLNSGDNLLAVWTDDQGWVRFDEAYFTEATEYKLRFTGDRPDVLIQGIPLPFYLKEGAWFAGMITPFQSGSLSISVNGNDSSIFVYPDNRKLTEQQYSLMIEEILQEANVCFQLSGMTVEVASSVRGRNISWTQWAYIEGFFQKLRQIFSKIEKQPLRRLKKQSDILKREKVQRAERVTFTWLDKKGYGSEIPAQVETVKVAETLNVFENQVLKQQTRDLQRLLRLYQESEIPEVQEKAKRYRFILQQWLQGALFSEIDENKGAFTVTQVFRKHPIYRLWYEWFDKLYKHERNGLGFSYPIALKDTFFLYEMWCYMRIIKILREAGLVEDTRSLFRTMKSGLFLHLAENHESRIELRNGVKLYFQRTYQYNSRNYYTYTQRMIPDIVLEGESGIVVFDPKYRVPGNLGTALGEMHKYRDGILERETGRKAVKEVYILTPTKQDHTENLRYFDPGYHEAFGMGAIGMVPGLDSEKIKEQVLRLYQLIK